MSKVIPLLSVFFLMVFGCASPPPSVTGTVKFNGQPLRSGTVLFHNDKGQIGHGVIEDGQYVISDAPLGEVRIVVKSHLAKPTGLPSRGGPPPTPPKGVVLPPVEKQDGILTSIPPRYSDPEKSGLRYSVVSGPQTHNIQLVP